VTVGYDVSDARVQHRAPFADQGVVPGTRVFYRALARNEAGVSEPSEVLGPITVSHRTLVDELWNEGRFFLREGPLAFRNSQARRFKEDAHRLSGETGAAVVYRCVGALQAARLYSFAEVDGEHLELAVSPDGLESAPITAERTALFPGDAATYGYLVPILFRLESPPADARFLRVESRGPIQLSRVEIDYHLP
jgi:hypothetical protein